MRSPSKKLLSLSKKSGQQVDKDLINALLDEGADPFENNGMGGPSAAYNAVKNSKLDMLALFIDHPAVNFNYNYCLDKSIDKKNRELTDFLLEQVKKNGERLESHYILKLAHNQDDYFLFSRLLDLFPSPDIYDGLGWFMPTEALQWSDEGYFERFITAGANVCLPLNIDEKHRYYDDENGRYRELSLIEYLAQRPKYHKQLSFVLEHGKVPFSALEKAFVKALKTSSSNTNIALLQATLEKQKWQFDPKWPSRIIHNEFRFTEGHSLTEVFNFKSNSGERISILKNLETDEESMTRESFSLIDDQAMIMEAAKKLKKAGGKPGDGQLFSKKLKPCDKTPARFKRN